MLRREEERRNKKEREVRKRLKQWQSWSKEECEVKKRSESAQGVEV